MSIRILKCEVFFSFTANDFVPFAICRCSQIISAKVPKSLKSIHQLQHAVTSNEAETEPLWTGYLFGWAAACGSPIFFFSPSTIKLLPSIATSKYFPCISFCGAVPQPAGQAASISDGAVRSMTDAALTPLESGLEIHEIKIGAYFAMWPSVV